MAKYNKKAAFASAKQQKFMFANMPKVAKEMVANAKKHHKPVLRRKSK